ncbi:phosphopantetheinyl transferase [Pseudonocardia nematodicida]|uniref:Phosphopantetheinyl transferase n=1 Tax=Pseudonocardia nematodicida TaxID=1206997 RepID=A0ABV1K9A0_9PSEU
MIPAQVPLAAAPVLVGVDVLEVDRVRRALDRDGTVYTRHVLAAGEHPLDPDPVLAVAAGVAVKESLVKAVGGRPAGFSWHDFAAAGPVALSGDAGVLPPDADALLSGAGALSDGAARALAAGLGVELGPPLAYAVRGASAAAARSRLTAGSDAVAGAARWGLRDSALVAVAVLVPAPTPLALAAEGPTS